MKIKYWTRKDKWIYSSSKHKNQKYTKKKSDSEKKHMMVMWLVVNEDGLVMESSVLCRFCNVKDNIKWLFVGLVLEHIDIGFYGLKGRV